MKSFHYYYLCISETRRKPGLISNVFLNSTGVGHERRVLQLWILFEVVAVVKIMNSTSFISQIISSFFFFFFATDTSRNSHLLLDE